MRLLICQLTLLACILIVCCVQINRIGLQLRANSHERTAVQRLPHQTCFDDWRRVLRL